MHILIAAAGIDKMGGMQRATIELANELTTRNHKVSLITNIDQNPTEQIQAYYYLQPDVNLTNINPLIKSYKNTNKTNRYLISSLYKTAKMLANNTQVNIEDSNLYKRIRWNKMHYRKVIAWRDTCLIIKPDIVIGVLPNTFTHLSIALKDIKIPLVINNHNNPWKDYSAERYSNDIIDLKYRQAAPSIATANTVLLPEFKSFFDPNVQKITYVIPNTVQRVEPNNQAHTGKSNNNNVIISAGRLTAVKDHSCLIKAFSTLINDFPNWQLKIYGEGELREELIQLIHSLSLADSAFILPPTKDINSEFRSSHIFAMPSQYEGWGLSLTEAMSHGLPAVGFNNASGVRSIIQDGVTGFLANGEDKVNSLSHYLKELMQNSELRVKMGNAGIEYVKQFSPKYVYTLWEQMLLEVNYRSHL